MRQWMSRVRALGLVVATCWVSSAAAHQLDRSVVLQGLRSRDPVEVRRALNAIKTLNPQAVTADLRAALFDALQREGDHAKSRAAARRRGETTVFRDDPELGVDLAQTVAALCDPAAIPSLVAALGLGAMTVNHCLADFGEQAAAGVAAAVMEPDASVSVATDGLITLRFMAEDGSVEQFSPNTQQLVRHVALRRLSGNQDVTVLWWSIDLAVTLADRELRRIVESFVADPKEVISRGVVEPALVTQTQKRAADRLAGVPPLPRRRPPA